jgi:hypothetical protein
MGAVHASILRLGSGLSTNGVLVSLLTVHPELVKGWSMPLPPLFQIDILGDFRESLYPPCYAPGAIPNCPDWTDIGGFGCLN